ncbi:MAG: DUF47 family protein [Clostridiales Family XIII bacterium]|jgi:predicted phosphate transport protein (TIGR00153 family)|nr:DUF47 family protein [Clostridiales Family XIII bacterium]
MAGKKGQMYYQSFVEMADYSHKAALFLQNVVRNYDPDKLVDLKTEMHAIEQAGDIAKHHMTKNLAKEFITPIEREDIMELASYIDTVTDKIEDVLLRLYMFNIKSIREDAIALADVIVTCTASMKQALEEIHNFKKSKTIHQLVVEVNRLEEEGDRLYTEAVRRVFTDTSISAVEAIAWEHIYHYMEDVCDACEDVADTVEGVIMKNS